jgi:hypothetical protein
MRGTVAKKLRQLARLGSTSEVPEVAYARKEHGSKPVFVNGRVIESPRHQIKVADSIRGRYLHLKKLYKDQ